MKLYVGNGSLEEYHNCKNLFGDCELLDRSTNLDINKNYHTSINDIEPTFLSNVIDMAEKVVVGNIPASDLITRVILQNKQLIDSKDIIGSEINVNQNQLVIIGCSHSYGVGLNNINERYGTIVSHNMNLEELNLSLPGAGIPYISNMFHRCKFNLNQKVIFQISSPDRIYEISNDKYRKLELENKNDQKVIASLTDELLLAIAFNNITNVIYTARRLNLNFLCFMLTEQYSLTEKLNYYLSGFIEYLPLYNYAIDFADDGHFGTQTHKYLAKLITSHYAGKNV